MSTSTSEPKNDHAPRHVSVKVSGPTPREFSWDVAALHKTWDGSFDSYLS